MNFLTFKSFTKDFKYSVKNFAHNLFISNFSFNIYNTELTLDLFVNPNDIDVETGSFNFQLLLNIIEKIFEFENSVDKGSKLHFTNIILEYNICDKNIPNSSFFILKIITNNNKTTNFYYSNIKNNEELFEALQKTNPKKLIY